MNVVVHPCYFGSIAQFVVLAKAHKVFFEAHDNYIKQTYRNRQYIYAANGKLLLNIPTKHTKENNGKQTFRDIAIENDFNWQIQHWRSLTSAYKTSPFFEYYEDDILTLYNEEFTSLYDFNLKSFEVIKECIQLDLPQDFTETFEKEISSKQDYRFLVNAKKSPLITLEPYTQVFGPKHGYIENLSILDLLFNEGPNTLNYLENQPLPVSR